jgi:hypothetical protein
MKISPFWSKLYEPLSKNKSHFNGNAAVDHPLLTAAASALGIHLEARGDMSLLDRPRRMLLVSRTEKFPQPDAPWLLNTIAAVLRSCEQHEALVTGLDRLAYETALYTAAQHEGGAIVIAAQPLENNASHVKLPRRHLLLWPRDVLPEKTAQQQRDRIIAHLCDRAWSIHVRKGGLMSDLAAELQQRQIPIEPLSISPSPPRPPREDSPTPPAARFDDASLTDWPYLTHFTRDPEGPWPGEDRAEYLRWLCAGRDTPHRDGFAALCRILDERRIRACGRLIPGGAPMVCFTARPARAVSALRRWRRGLMRWNFTPYALCIPRERLVHLGARPVSYLTRAELKAAPAEQQALLQTQRSGDNDWSAEEEWRVAGDVALQALELNTFVACVAFPAEARQLYERYGLRSIVLEPIRPDSRI